MTLPAEPAGASSGFPQAAVAALQDVAARSGVNARGASLVRVFSSAVYYLPAADAVARVAQWTSPASVSRLETSISVTRWLTRTGFPTVEPLPVEQPVTSHGCVVTFWRYLRQDGSKPTVADLGRLLRQLHQLAPPPAMQLPAYRPLISVRRAIEASRAISEDDRAWLKDYSGQLLAAYGQLTFLLPAGMIHGDAWRGNLLRDGHEVVLADWDNVSTGPREIDLVPTLQAPRFGLPQAERDAFIAAYGRDIRSWDGYRIMRDMRELSTLSAILRDAHADDKARHELGIRLRSIRQGDDRQWTSF
jgi:aminoglycoside phosphotransferase